MMATLQEALLATMQDDVTLTALIPAVNMFESNELPEDGGGYAWAPKASNGVEIAPFCVLHMQDVNPHQELRTVIPERVNLELHVYQQRTFSVINPFLIAAAKLLRDRYFHDLDDVPFAHVLQQVFRSRELMAEEFGSASQKFARFTIVQVLER